MVLPQKQACEQTCSSKNVGTVPCEVCRTSPLAEMQRSPQAKRAQQFPGGNTAGVQPAFLLLQACRQLAVWQCLYWQPGSIMGVAVQHEAIMLCSSPVDIIVTVWLESLQP